MYKNWAQGPNHLVILWIDATQEKSTMGNRCDRTEKSIQLCIDDMKPTDLKKTLLN